MNFCRPPMHLPLTALLLASAISADAAAALPLEGVDADEPATWRMSLEELEDVGLGQYRGDPIPVPDGAPYEHDPEDAVSAKQGVMFINFDGAQLSSGFDDSRNDVTQIDELVGSFAAYGAGSKRDAVVQAVRNDWQDFNMVVTDTRPVSGDYTMNMTGPSNAFGNNVLGVAPLDCNDAQTHNNITYAFHTANDQFSAATQATTVSQEVAHSYGLEHVDEPGDIMNPFNAGGDPAFRDDCIAIVQGGNCASQHIEECNSAQAQNSYRELLTLFGTSAPDTQAPSVQITEPQDGDTFDEGASFTISVAVTDDNAVQDVSLYLDGSVIETDTTPPYGWDASDATAGTYEFQVEARDLAGNTATSSIVTVYVGDAAPDPGGSDDGGDGGDDDGGNSGGNDSGGSGSATGDTNALPPGYGQDDAEASGCACASQSGVGMSAQLLALLGLMGLRRRR